MSLARSLAARGVSPTSPPAERAAAVVRALPLRLAGGGAEDPAESLARGWIQGRAEAGALLAAVTGWHEDSGRAFGTTWPLLVHNGEVVAPALPVPVPLSGREAQGPDGVYTAAAGAVWRETGGAEQRFLELSARAAAAIAECDLLWFGAGERYLVRGAELEVSDLFAVLRLAATAARLERLLVRERRLAPDILDGLEPATGTRRSRLAVQRHRALVPGGCPVPADLLAARADVRRVQVSGHELEAHLEPDGRAVFEERPGESGWCLELVAGDYPLSALALHESAGYLVYEVDLGPALDPLRPGLRGRLAFDLTSDLMVVSR